MRRLLRDVGEDQALGDTTTLDVSTGTWVVSFAVGGRLDQLDPARDTLANVDAFGKAVPSARFMGGREFDMLTAGSAAEPDAEVLARVIRDQLMILPSVVQGSGPYPAHASNLVEWQVALVRRTECGGITLYGIDDGDTVSN